jgi:hypothetical protein
MKTRTRNTIKVLPLFAILMAFAVAGTGAKSAAEWPAASCKEAAMSRDSVLTTQIRGEVSARREFLLPIRQAQGPEY